VATLKQALHCFAHAEKRVIRGRLLFAIHARADTHKTKMDYSVPQLEPGKAKLVDLASLPPPLRRTVDDEVKRLRAGDGVLYGDMTSDEAHGLESYGERVLPPADVAGHTMVPLADVSASELAAYALAGVVPDGPGKDGRWSSLSRVYRRPDGVLVTLHEWAYAADGGGVLGVRELMNATVRHGAANYLAQFAIRRAMTGQVVSELRWFTDAKVFTLNVGQDVVADGGQDRGKAWLLRMAEAINLTGMLRPAAGRTPCAGRGCGRTPRTRRRRRPRSRPACARRRAAPA
jgi:hypothetical protein